MGCGKSKPKDVVTGNTIVTTTRKNTTSNDDDNAEKEPKKISKDIETTITQEKPTTTNEETIENVNQEEEDDHHETHETEKAVQVAAVPEVKEIPENNMEILVDDDNHQEQEIVAESTVVIDQNVENNEGNEQEQEEIVAVDVDVDVAVGVEDEIVESAGERLISRDSPNHFYSSRKDEEAIGSVVSEISSEYDSPRHDNVKDEKESEINGQPATIIKEVEEATIVTAPEAITTAAVMEKEVKVGEEQLIESSQPKI